MCNCLSCADLYYFELFIQNQERTVPGKPAVPSEVTEPGELYQGFRQAEYESNVYQHVCLHRNQCPDPCCTVWNNSLGDRKMPQKVFQICVCIFYCGNPDPVSGFVPDNLYHRLQNASHQYEIWDHTDVCCYRTFFRSLSDDQLYEYSSSGTGGISQN